ncbi:trypsin-like serine peptidase, partial [Glaciimonas sp. GG7]
MKYNKHIISLSIALIFGSLIQTVHATPENLPVAVKKESPQARKAQQIKIDVAKSGIALQDQKAMRTILTSPNAQYIKVYFSAFSLPDGAYVELSHPVSGERYRYTNDTVRRDLQGLMPAMSVSGETVVLEIVDPSGSFDSAQHSVVIDQYHTTTQSVVMRAPPDATAEHVPNLRIRPACFNDDKDDLEKQAIYHYSRPIALVNNYNPNEQGYGSYGSAWRVGEPMKDENGGLRFLMFTNHHVFKDSHDDSKVEVWFDHEHINCKHDLRRPHLDRGKAPVKFAAKKKLRSNSGRDLDYQLFELQVSPEDVAKLKSFGYLGLDITTATEGQGIYIPQHGTDPNVGYENDEVVLKTIATITPDGESCKLDYVFETIEENIRYSCPTSGATSGSPVTNSDTHTVVGLHNGGYTPDDGSLKINFAAMMQYIWREVAPDFGSVVPVSYPIIDTVIDDSVEPEPIID